MLPQNPILCTCISNSDCGCLHSETLCVSSQIKDTKHIELAPGSCPRSAGSCPRGGTWGHGGAQGVKFFSSNMVMLHIKLTGMMSRTEC